MTTAAAGAHPPVGTRSAVTTRLPAVALVGVAAVLAVCSIAVLQWFRSDYPGGAGNDASFRHIYRTVTGPDGGGAVSYGFSAIYYFWLGPTLAAAVLLAALGHAVTRARALRIVTAALAVIAIASTLWALELFTVRDSAYVDVAGGVAPRTGYLDWLGRTDVGPWALLLAYVLCLVSLAVRGHRPR